MSPPNTPIGQSRLAEVRIHGNTLNVQSTKEQAATIRICNILGQVLSTQKVWLYNGNTEFELNWPSQNNPSLYLINIEYDNKSETMKIIK